MTARRPRPAKDPDPRKPLQQPTNVLMAGVGGQGVLIASEVLALAALATGLRAKQSEVHGVAQRGGSVVSHVRFGPQIYSPLIRCGEVDMLCAAEKLEAIRYAHYVRPNGTFVINDQVIRPIRMPGEGERRYPEDVTAFLRKKGYEVLLIPALSEALRLGDKRCANVVLLGVLSTRLDIGDESWLSALAERLPTATLERNLLAFDTGRRLAADIGIT